LELPGRRRAASGRELGQHAERRAQPARADLVPVDAAGAGHGHLPHGDGVQLLRRRASRRARSAPDHGRPGVSERLLELRELQTHFFTDDGLVRAVDGVSLVLAPGETLAVVGESGSGKSVTALSILRLVPTPPGRIVGGSIRFRGRELLTLAEPEMRAIRGKE